jgi:lipopolysaccharide transport system ATP-binding protein
MSDVAIRIEGLSKQYRIGKKQQGYSTLREVLVDSFTAPFRRTASLLRGQAYGAAGLDEIIWALKDVSFEVQRGDVVGIIGRNGAGKSTLLKILSRITEPTQGRVHVFGRVGALLEVGTGFHYELTGRENVYLNGAILGMTRAEIERKFDEMVAFAEIDTFIDTPVKHYSSGMALRLGFAVAAHLEPEILIVDEVLAVGDANFQKKCLGKMEDAASEGRTVLLVSHNMSAILSLCSKAVLMENGQVAMHGQADSVVTHYLGGNVTASEMSLVSHPKRREKFQKLMTRVSLMVNDEQSSVFKTNGPFKFVVECQVDVSLASCLALGIMVKDISGRNLFSTNMRQSNKMVSNPGGSVRLWGQIDALALTPGIYSLSLFLGNDHYDLDIVDEVIFFDVIWDSDLPLAYPSFPQWGSLFLPASQWGIEPGTDKAGDV